MKSSTASHFFQDRQGYAVSRRDLLTRCSMGFPILGLSALMASENRLGARAVEKKEGPLAVRDPDFPAKVKSVILCHMSGGFSHIDSFDPKPRLDQEAGLPLPMKVERTMFNQNGKIFPSPWKFNNYGESGIPVSDLFPHIGSCADDLTVIRSMTATFNEHAQANFFLHSGRPLAGFPSVGAWTTYGLGSENQNLPGFVVLGGGGIPLGGPNMFGNGFLPAVHQGSVIHPGRDEPMVNIRPRETDQLQRKRLAFVDDIDRSFLEKTGHPQVEAAIRNYETAYRMQTAVPELVDFSGESEATKKLYGMDSTVPQKAAYATQCLLARRLVERGVRFIETTIANHPGITNVGNPWDQHQRLIEGHEANAFEVDQPIAGLIKDLKARGLLEQTLVVFAGEFGRTPFTQTNFDFQPKGKYGRDHNPWGFSLWLAGGGLRSGLIYGATDEYGYHAIEGRLTFYDLHATILHLLGLDHEKLTYRFGGRDFRLTDVHGNVIQDILV